MTKLLTQQQKKIYDFIVVHKSAHNGNSPSIREICAIFNTSTSVARYSLQRLEAHGLIHVDPTSARSIEVIGSHWLPPGVKEIPNA